MSAATAPPDNSLFEYDAPSHVSLPRRLRRRPLPHNRPPPSGPSSPSSSPPLPPPLPQVIDLKAALAVLSARSSLPSSSAPPDPWFLVPHPSHFSIPAPVKTPKGPSSRRKTQSAFQDLKDLTNTGKEARGKEARGKKRSKSTSDGLGAAAAQPGARSVTTRPQR